MCIRDRSSIDIIITDPPENPWRGKDRPGSPMTLQEYYKWNNNWLEEAHRALKSTGALYLFCDWRLSGMYHSMLTNFLHIQTRITWRKMLAGETSKALTWKNQTSDIWFATKTNDFLFHNRSRESSTNDCNIRRYKFSDGSLSTVFKEEYCQFNYGLRLFSNELWVIGTYDKRLLRLNGLDNDTLNNLGYFPSGNWGSSYGGNDNLTEVGDLTLTNGNIYFGDILISLRELEVAQKYGLNYFKLMLLPFAFCFCYK